MLLWGCSAAPDETVDKEFLGIKSLKKTTYIVSKDGRKMNKGRAFGGTREFYDRNGNKFKTEMLSPYGTVRATYAFDHTRNINVRYSGSNSDDIKTTGQELREVPEVEVIAVDSMGNWIEKISFTYGSMFGYRTKREIKYY